MSNTFDVIVVGGGPGGYVAAIRAAQLGLKTALVEQDRLGGVCLNWGCIPTKALLQGAATARALAAATEFGFDTAAPAFDIRRLVQRSRTIAAQLSGGIDQLLRKHAIRVITGRARLVAKGRLLASGGDGDIDCRGRHIILATGARPRSLPGIETDGKRIWHHFEAMVPQQLPGSLLVIGSGAIGVEFASLYSDLGSEVSLVEAADRIMPQEDADVSDFAAAQFRRQGMHIHCATTVSAVQKHNGAVTCTLRAKDGSESQRRVDRVIVAVGVRGNIEDLGLEQMGCEIHNSFIQTDAWCRTNIAGLYAIGDVAGPPCLAHKASREAVICVEKLAGVDAVCALQKSRLPACTYCHPQVASVGLTEAQAAARGGAIKVGRFHLRANGRALALGESEGFVKTIFDAASGELLGAHMIGPEVTEQIQGFGIAQTLEATETDLARAVFPHPTLSEAMHEAVLDACGMALHQ